ncbi:ADP-forming succinate--CoA ligase subunit beta [SAR202 cluster bacterium AD-804-J14_MRT_500m]|nr:ADP-forming succinate--CoA ligase subunit beta [SAR202 cluster bacterium AD-804-J14_MRT_500m]
MNIHEYQAKKLLEQYNIPVPRGQVALSAEEAQTICQELGGKAVIKAQVYAGGRGKAGGVKLVNSPDEAHGYVASLIGSNLVTQQTGPEGVPVHKVLIEDPADIEQELYLAITIDRVTQGPMFIASASGGMAIEELAITHPERIVTQGIDIAIGVQPFQARRINRELGLSKELATSATRIMSSIYELFMACDCTLIEINPLVVTPGGLIAVDAKIELEDDALFRNTGFADWSDPAQRSNLEVDASQSNIAYVKLDGSVGCLVNGAGLAMATLDLVQNAGLKPSNFLDVGGDADINKVTKAVDIMLSDPDVSAVLVNIFGGILRCDVVATGIVAAFAERKSRIPLTVRMSGTNVDEGRNILSQSGLAVTFANTLNELEQCLTS